MEQTSLQIQAFGVTAAIGENVLTITAAVLLGSLMSIGWTQLRKEGIIRKMRAGNPDLSKTGIFKLPSYEVQRWRVRWEAVWTAGVFTGAFILLLVPDLQWRLAVLFAPLSAVLSLVTYRVWHRWVGPKIYGS